MSDFDREKGILAIIELQAVVGIEETRKEAEAGWDSLSENERSQTMAAHRMVCGGFSDD